MDLAGVRLVYWAGRCARSWGDWWSSGSLGRWRLLAGGEPVGLGSAQQRAVLALLMVEAGEPVSRDRLIDELWGERPPATAAHAVQVYVSAIRKLLRAGGDEAVRRLPGGVRAGGRPRAGRRPAL